jgi:ssDNA-binding Zn-finger/Zn-ribbon topoisomerase 1
MDALKKTMHDKYVLQICPKCKKGELKMIYSKRTHKRFLACSAYPKCHNCWPLPQLGSLKFLDTKCESCNTRKIAIFKQGSRPWFLCPNPACPKKIEMAAAKEQKAKDELKAAERKGPIQKQKSK